MLVKPVKHRSRISAIYNQKHACLHMLWHQIIFLDSAVLLPRFGETLTPLENVNLFRLPPIAGVERPGRPLDFFSRMC